MANNRLFNFPSRSEAWMSFNANGFTFLCSEEKLAKLLSKSGLNKRHGAGANCKS